VTHVTADYSGRFWFSESSRGTCSNIVVSKNRDLRGRIGRNEYFRAGLNSLQAAPFRKMFFFLAR
jgi:hypothetical protein